ncbi:MAG: sensor histidine kinase [Caldilinea sp.]|nr:sensor histidine kinase [Caldilinea sp.]MDW8439224.1 sensor histidine kinase [Caldilineaceae bacterium]
MVDSNQSGGISKTSALLSHRILSVAEEELARIVLDIHDGPVQYLFSALSLLTGVQNDLAERGAPPDITARLAQVGMLLESSLYEIKYFLGTFRPPEFRQRSLSSIVEGLVIQHEEWTGATVHLEMDAVPEHVPLAVKIALYRVLQEALSNANRHAGVAEQWVRLWGEPGRICMEVADDGRGFEPPDLENPIESSHADHIGLLGMRDRIALLNGVFRIESSPGRGAKILVTIPLDQVETSFSPAVEP